MSVCRDLVTSCKATPTQAPSRIASPRPFELHDTVAQHQSVGPVVLGMQEPAAAAAPAPAVSQKESIEAAELRVAADAVWWRPHANMQLKKMIAHHLIASPVGPAGAMV